MVRKCFARIALVAISMTVGINILYSQEFRNYQLEELVVSSSRIPIDLNRSARVVTVLDSIAIKASPAHTMNDLLKYAIGVDVRQRGGMGVQTDIGMRGGTSDQIAILINGINVCDPQTGHFALDLPMDKSDIERIEILEGPAGRIYGTSSLVGAINIITKKPVKSSADVRLEGGSHGSFSGTARGAIANGKYSNSISFGYGRSDGYLRNSNGKLNSDHDAFKAFYQGQYIGADADILWLAGISDKAFGANTFYSVKYDDQYEHTSKAYFAVQAETKGMVHFKPSVYWMHSRDRFELFRDDESKVPFNYHRTNVYGLNLGSYFNWKLGKTAFGAEMRNEDVLSTTLGDSLNTPKHIQGTNREYFLGKNRTNISFYLEHNVLLRRLTFSGGVTAVKNTGSEMSFRLYPGADMSVRIGENWKAYASWNTSLRMPTFTELYYSVGGHKADKYLKPEEMTAYEAGLKYSRSWLSAQACVYLHRGRNMIDWIRDSSLGDEAVWTSVNHTKINAVGEEISLMVDMPSLLGRNFFLRSLYLGWSHIDQDKNVGENIQSQYSLEYLRNKVVAKVDMNITGAVDVNLSWRWQQRAGNYVPYSLVDARIGWRQFFLNIENLLNHEYSDFGGVPQPKLWISAGVTVSLYPHFSL
ncbi:MAG: TonB-dependent receptor [Bacteroidales bacterium]|jgi:iron complex outermembrane receptor protein|nr:TonB-dependent receptor [Bacteroidales bacterium]MCI2133293.1 TonB-dependent receptor [Bacteroidales bacterium]